MKASAALGASALFAPAYASVSAAESPGETSGRAFWVEQMTRVALPVLENLSRGRLRASMPVQAYRGMEESRRHTTYLEALGRLLAGIAPWLESGPSIGDEGALRTQYLELTRSALEKGVDPTSPDYLQFGSETQTLVDAAFLSLAILRAPMQLNTALDHTVRTRLCDGLRATRALLPGFNNWLLFAAVIEAALFKMGEPWDRMRVDYALREHMGWYLGDGVYGDGPRFRCDYYNSFVIHPFLLATLDAVGSEQSAWQEMMAPVTERAARYAHEQERMIAPDGSYPVLGRSITYRCGAFHLLADVTLRRALPEDVSPAQVRCALAATIRRTLGARGTFDTHGWLRIGLAGDQPSLGEPYISTGSLYLCANVFLPLGLPAQDPFWSGADTPWTSKKIWAGIDAPADHASDA